LDGCFALGVDCLVLALGVVLPVSPMARFGLSPEFPEEKRGVVDPDRFGV